MRKIIPVLLSGGAGTRLWPLSREGLPKQLLSLTGGESLLQQTARRVSDPTLFDAPMVVANIEHRFVVAEQLRTIGMIGARMILEPVGRNTAPAAAVAAILAARADPGSILLLTPADHDIGNPEEFHATLRAGLAAAQKGSFVLFGIEPTHPATGYGYVRMGEPASEGAIVRRVLNFKEKPEIAVAESYLAAGDYVWNSGIFLLPAQRFLDELNLLEPDMLRACEETAAAAKRDLDFLRLDPEAFARARDVSIDYAVMERTGNAVVVPASFPWSDIGTWSSLCEAGERDEQGTVALGKVIALDTESCYIRSEGPLVAALGVKDLIIVAAQDAILVTSKGRDEDMRRLVARLKATGYEAATQTVRIDRPWGFYQPLQRGEGFQIRQVIVNPGARLPLQRHRRRAEHWIVVNGMALVTRDGERIRLNENEAVRISTGCVHRLENPGDAPLNLIKVQSGDHLSEDGIVRAEDCRARL